VPRCVCCDLRKQSRSILASLSSYHAIHNANGSIVVYHFLVKDDPVETETANFIYAIFEIKSP
jgi:hypothetical protein